MREQQALQEIIHEASGFVANAVVHMAGAGSLQRRSVLIVDHSEQFGGGLIEPGDQGIDCTTCLGSARVSVFVVPTDELAQRVQSYAPGVTEGLERTMDPDSVHVVVFAFGASTRETMWLPPGMHRSLQARMN